GHVQGAPVAVAAAAALADGVAGAAGAADSLIPAEGSIGQSDGARRNVQAAASGIVTWAAVIRRNLPRGTVAALGLIAVDRHVIETKRSRAVDGAAFRCDARALRETARQRQVLKSQRAADGHLEQAKRRRSRSRASLNGIVETGSARDGD